MKCKYEQNDKKTCNDNILGYCDRDKDLCEGIINNVITEQSTKDRCAPEIIKQMVELAEGFEIKGNSISYFNEFNCSTISIITTWLSFPLLIQRAIKNFKVVLDYQEKRLYSYDLQKEYEFKNYQVETLTQEECACLDCMIETIRRNKDNV